jgi:hypothetical protein
LCKQFFFPTVSPGQWSTVIGYISKQNIVIVDSVKNCRYKKKSKFTGLLE